MSLAPAWRIRDLSDGSSPPGHLVNVLTPSSARGSDRKICFANRLHKGNRAEGILAVRGSEAVDSVCLGVLFQ